MSQRDRFFRHPTRSSLPPPPLFDTDVEMGQIAQTTSTSSRGGGSQHQRVLQQRRLQANVPVTGVPPLSQRSSHRGSTHASQQSAKQLSQISELYNQMAALSAQNEECQLELERLRGERDQAQKDADDAEREVQHLRRQLEEERRRSKAAQASCRQWQGHIQSFSFDDFFIPEPRLPLATISQSSSTSSIPNRSPALSMSSLSRPQLPPFTFGVNRIGTTTLSRFTRLPTTPAPQPMTPSLPSSSASTSSGSTAPPLPHFIPVSDSELKATRQAEHDRNLKLKLQRENWIQENERKHRAGEDLVYNSWDAYKHAELDNDDDDDDDYTMPSIPSSAKRTSEEEDQRSRTESTSSTSTEHHTSAPNPNTPTQIHSRSIPQSQTEAEIFFTRAHDGDTSAQQALNNCVAVVNQLHREARTVPSGLAYVMDVFNHMESTPQWRRNDAKRRQKKNPRSQKKQKPRLPTMGPGGIRRPHPPGFTHLVPRDQAPAGRMWRNDDPLSYWAGYILRNEDTFDTFYQRHPHLRYENGSISLTDLRSLRVFLILRPSTALGQSSIHLAYARFQVVLAELLASPGEYGYLVQRYSLGDPLNWSPRPFDGVVSNLDTLEMARFLVSVGFPVRRADDAQSYWRHWLIRMADEFSMDNVDYRGILSRTFRPTRRLPYPLFDQLIWFPRHPQGLDNRTPISGEHVQMPLDIPPAGIQPVPIQYPPLPPTPNPMHSMSSDQNVNMEGTREEMAPSTQSSGESSVVTEGPTSSTTGVPLFHSQIQE